MDRRRLEIKWQNCKKVHSMKKQNIFCNLKRNAKTQSSIDETLSDLKANILI